MKPVARDAGSRRGALKAAAGLFALLCSGRAAATQPRREAFLRPLFTITGARLITRTDVAGGVTPDALGNHVSLIFPVAVAASFNDIYIADAGAARLYRYDRSLDAMAVMPALRVNHSTRLHAGPDGSIYILDPFSAEIHRYARGGQPLPSLRPRPTGRYSSFTIDPLSGKAYALDAAHLAIDEIQPLGQMSLEFQRIDEAGPIATDGRGLYIAGARCGCVVEWIDSRQGRRFGAGKLRQPVALAVAGPDVYVLDGFDRSVALVHEEGIEAMSPAALGMLAPESLAAASGMILIADGAGHKVTAFGAAGKRLR